MAQQELKLQKINQEFFGKERTNRYVMNIYRECVDKLITTNTLIEVWSRTKGAHEHINGRNCNQCDMFFQIYHSCTDSLFLHMRLLFSKEEPYLADAFLKTINNLNIDDFKSYYSTKYQHNLIPEEIGVIKPLPILAGENLSKISALYMKRIEPYQNFAFHQPSNGKYYKVDTTRQNGEGIKFVTHSRRQKFKRDLAAVKEMLDLFTEVIHSYLRLSSTYFHVLKVFPENYAKEMSTFIGVELSESVMSDIVNDITKHTGKMIHMLECGDGLSSHNKLEYIKIKATLSRLPNKS